MNSQKLKSRLKEMYLSANIGEKSMMIRLFGIIYAEEIKVEGVTPKELASSIENDNYHAEISKGMKLAKYVTLKDDFKHLKVYI